MTPQEFDSLLNKDKYQVFVFTSFCSFPIDNFAKHTWFVINKKGDISRWEVLHRKKFSSTSWGHLHKNFFLPWQGIEIFVNFPPYRWKSSLLHLIEGDENSQAAKMAEFIQRSSEIYLYKNQYHFFPGPNSNTYTRWVLDNFPELNIKLPWNCFGKNYKIK